MRRLFLLCLVLSGCAARMPIPGPMRSLGRTPTSTAITTAAIAEAPPPPARVDTRSERRREDAGRAVAAAARHYLNHSLEGFRDDCSGFVCAATTRAGKPMSGNTASLWAELDALGATHTRKIPAVGDLAFFDNTYDRNRDGRLNDDLTHVGIVIAVDSDGTITLAHGGTSAGRSELHMNLRYPDDHRAPDGAVRNDYLRRRRSSDSSRTPHLAGQMWRGFATLPE